MAAEIAIYVAIAAVLIQRYSWEVNSFDPTAIRISTHFSIIDGTAVDPYRFRILIPEIVSGILSVLRLDQSAETLDRTYFIFIGLCFVITMLLLRLLLTKLGWSRGASLSGPILVAALLPVSFTNHDFQPWTWLEGATILGLFLALISRANLMWIGSISVIAALNRETAIALACIPLALMIANRTGGRLFQDYFFRALLAVVFPWITVRLLLLYAWPGPATSRAISLDEIWQRNTNFSGDLSLQWGGWLSTVVSVGLFLGPILIAALVGVLNRTVPRDAMYVAIISVPVYLAGWIVFAIWSEVRVLFPVLLLLMPLAVAAFGSPLTKRGSE
jgi:hypothetical protein